MYFEPEKNDLIIIDNMPIDYIIPINRSLPNIYIYIHIICIIGYLNLKASTYTIYISKIDRLCTYILFCYYTNIHI